ncbi:UNVERIFIED_CONTAM: hypothetical protein Sradi_4075500 [Sesamum radiatum]|uniref:NB-ARC domain-containing protein n=1 Tax=Sesamum radiatum TaxID=300843 RepID=A0AAW2PPH6_SESRA
MAGIGKTTLVKEVYDDASIGQIFHYRAWAVMGPNYRKRDILSLLRAWDDLKSCFPDDGNGSRVILTTRLRMWLFMQLEAPETFIISDS